MTLGSFDLELLRIINHPSTPIVNLIFVLISYSIYPLLFYLAYYFYKNRERKIFTHLVVAALIGFIFVSAIKYIVDRPRPYIENPELIQNIISLSDPSFPSRHTFTAFLLLRFVPKKFSKWVRRGIFFYLLVIPFTMMYIGVHYPTDILGGLLIGLATPIIISEKISMKISNFIFSINIKRLDRAS